MHEDDLKEIRDAIRTFIKDHPGVTYRDVARMLNVPHSTVHRFLNDEKYSPRRATVVRLYDMLRQLTKPAFPGKEGDGDNVIDIIAPQRSLGRVPLLGSWQEVEMYVNHFRTSGRPPNTETKPHIAPPEYSDPRTRDGFAVQVNELTLSYHQDIRIPAGSYLFLHPVKPGELEQSGLTQAVAVVEHTPIGETTRIFPTVIEKHSGVWAMFKVLTQPSAIHPSDVLALAWAYSNILIAD